MTRRMLTALVALVGLFVAMYLALYKAGAIGTLALWELSPRDWRESTIGPRW